MLTTLNILAILLGMTILGLVGYFVVKNIINRSQKPSPPPGCSSSNCDGCTNQLDCDNQGGCLYDQVSNKCLDRSAPPPPPPIPPGCSSSDCSKCTDEYSCDLQEDSCVYDQDSMTCLDKSCNIPQDQRINAPTCDGWTNDCTKETVCRDSPGNPCFQEINPDPNYIPYCYVRNGKSCPVPSLNTSVNVYRTTNKCLSAEAGGTGKCSDLVPNSLPQNVTLGTRVTNGTTPMITQQSDTYTQYWTKIDGGNGNMPSPTKDTPACGKGDDPCVPPNNKRAIAVTVPKTNAPPEGFPYVLCWQFMGLDGYGTGGWSDAIGGIAEMTKEGKELKDDAGTGLATYMLMLKYIVSAGYVLVNISEFVYDTEYWMECKTNNKSVDQMCWNKGGNVDADALKVLFDRIKNNNLIPNIKLKLNYNNMAALGYSVGAHMVSRMINDFPFMQTKNGKPMPSIKLGIMIGGGSYWCYNYDGEGNETNSVPPSYLPCADKDEGCCPNNKTEDNYDHNGKPHPPVLLLQGHHDMFASWEASSYYFNLLSSRGDPVYRVMGPTLDSLKWDRGPEGRHGVYACQIPSIIALLQLYLK